MCRRKPQDVASPPTCWNATPARGQWAQVLNLLRHSALALSAWIWVFCFAFGSGICLLLLESLILCYCWTIETPMLGSTHTEVVCCLRMQANGHPSHPTAECQAPPLLSVFPAYWPHTTWTSPAKELRSRDESAGTLSIATLRQSETSGMPGCRLRLWL